MFMHVCTKFQLHYYFELLQRRAVYKYLSLLLSVAKDPALLLQITQSPLLLCLYIINETFLHDEDISEFQDNLNKCFLSTASS